MVATLKLNLSESLSIRECNELVHVAERLKMPVERLLLLAAKDYLDRNGPRDPAPVAQPQTQEGPR